MKSKRDRLLAFVESEKASEAEYGQAHYLAWCAESVRGEGPPFAAIPSKARDLHVRVAKRLRLRERDAAIAEVERMRRELEAWKRDAERDALELEYWSPLAIVERIDRVLGEESEHG